MLLQILNTEQNSLFGINPLEFSLRNVCLKGDEPFASLELGQGKVTLQLADLVQKKMSFVLYIDDTNSLERTIQTFFNDTIATLRKFYKVEMA